MQQVKIYIETDSSSPKATEKHYGYVLEVMVSGQAVTREGFGKITGTYHQTVLTALFNPFRGILWKNNVCKLRAHFRTDDKNIKVLKSLKGVDITPEVPEE